MAPHQTILITGAGKGIGRALALAYAGPQATLLLLGRDRASLTDISGECAQKGAKCDIVEADVRDGKNMRSLLFQLDEKTPIDLVIANAGVTSGLTSVDKPEPWSGIQEVANTNFTGVLNTVAPIVERMMTRREGQIAIMGSLAANIGLPSSPAYSAAKSGIEAYGMALRFGLARHNIKVNVICPGYVDTDMSRKLTGAQPFCVSPDKAAKIICRGLAKNKARTIFPLPLKWAYFFLSPMPASLSHFILSFFSFTVHRND